MSSESSTYRIDESVRRALLLEAQLREARASASQARAQLEAALAELRRAEQACGARMEEVRAPHYPGEGASREDCERYVVDARQAIAAAASETARASAYRRWASQIQNTGTRARPTEAWVETERSKNGAAAPVVFDRSTLLGDAERIVQRAPGDLTARERSEIEKVLADIRYCDNATEADNLRTRLRSCVQNARDRERSAQRERVDAARLEAEMYGLRGADVDNVRTALQDVANGHAPWSDELRKRADAARLAAIKRVEDEHASRVLKEAMTSLGYEVGPDFDGLFGGEGSALVALPAPPDGPRPTGHAARLDVEEGALRWRLVRFRDVDSDPKLDKATEAKFCNDMLKVHAAAGQRGMRLSAAGGRPERGAALQVVDRPPHIEAPNERGHEAPAVLQRPPPGS